MQPGLVIGRVKQISEAIASDKDLVLRNEYFYIEHSHSCAVPGYLIVSPTVSETSIAELPVAFQTHIGLSLASATRLIGDVINPLKIYCAQF